MANLSLSAFSQERWSQILGKDFEYPELIRQRSTAALCCSVTSYPIFKSKLESVTQSILRVSILRSGWSIIEIDEAEMGGDWGERFDGLSGALEIDDLGNFLLPDSERSRQWTLTNHST